MTLEIGILKVFSSLDSVRIESDNMGKKISTVPVGRLGAQ